MNWARRIFEILSPGGATGGPWLEQIYNYFAANGAPVTTSEFNSAIEDIDMALEDKLDITSTFTNTATSGTNAIVAETVTVAPTGNTTQVPIGQRIQMDYNSSFNVTTGGYMVGRETVLNTAGTGTHDKMVIDMAQLNLTGGDVASAICYEGVISTVGSSTDIAALAIFYVPNMSGVANIANVANMAAFQNDHTEAAIRSAGPFQNQLGVEIAPSRSAGVQAGRYYSSPLKSMTTNVVAANVIYVTYVYVPRRCTVTKLGCNVTTGATGNVILGLYKVADNMLTTLVTQTSSLSTSSIAAVEGTVSQRIDSGVYALVAVFSGTPTIGWHEINTHDMIGGSSPTGYSEQTYIPFTFGTLPSTANTTPTFAANTIEPHLWFRT